MLVMMQQNMSDCHEAFFCAVGAEECVLVDEEYIYGKLHILLELNQLARDFDHTLNKSLCIPPYSVPFHLEDLATPNDFSSLYIFRRDFTSWDATSTDNSPEICSGWEDHFLI
jgi:hypothetical protein